MARIAIVTEKDAVWALSAWERTLPLLAGAGHAVAGIWAVEPRLGRYRGIRIPLWYLRRLGIAPFALLAAFALWHRLARLRRGRPLSLQALARARGCAYFETASPNDAPLAAWLKAEQVDVLLISLGHILKGDVLRAPRMGIINKHAGLLPANRGLWPYVWAVVKGLPQGISYHLVHERVDDGPLLLVHRDVPPQALESMVAWYVHGYRLFPQHMAEAVARLLAGDFPAQAGEYDAGRDARPYPLPEAQTMADFRHKGGRVIRLQDVPLAASLPGDA